MKVAVAIGSWKGSITWDVSTGDPIVPAPRMVELPRLIGEPIRLLRYAKAVAAYRGVVLGPVNPVIAGYGEVGQEKWAAWRRSEQLETVSEALLDGQMEKVAAILDPVFSRA